MNKSRNKLRFSVQATGLLDELIEGEVALENIEFGHMSSFRLFS